ncbi:MAG: hypothetical protein ACHBMF_03795 [Chromatiales bacterium]
MAQILRAVPFNAWPGVYVCCSGTLRFEGCLRARNANISIVGNDVSAYSCVLGAVASGAEFPIRFHGRLEFIEESLAGDDGFIRRAAAVLAAFQMADYVGVTVHATTHFDHYKRHFAHYLERARRELTGKMQALKLQGFYNGDWRDHVDNAIARGQGIVAFPPFFKGDYEAMHRFVHENITWPAPSYDVYDPQTLGSIVNRIAASGVPYCVLSDQVFADPKPFLKFTKRRKVPHYCYGTSTMAALTHIRLIAKAFSFRAVDPAKLGRDTKVRFVKAASQSAVYIRDRYLAKGINHTKAAMEFFVYLDDMLLGLIGYSLSRVRRTRETKLPHLLHGVHTTGHRIGRIRRTAEETLHVLCDLCTSREAKLSKLIARMALSRELTAQMDLKYLTRFVMVLTTARTKAPVSMKYRGIYDLLNRRPADDPSEGFVLQYGSRPEELSLDKMFEWWRKKYHPESHARG